MTRLSDFHTSSLDSSSSTSVDTEGTLGLCQEIWSRRSLKRDPWLAAWAMVKCRQFQRGSREELLPSATDPEHGAQRHVWRSQIYKPQPTTSLFQEQLQPLPNLPNPAPGLALWEEQSPALPGTCRKALCHCSDHQEEPPLQWHTLKQHQTLSSSNWGIKASTILKHKGRKYLKTLILGMGKNISMITYILSFRAGLKSYNNT